MLWELIILNICYILCTWNLTKKHIMIYWSNWINIRFCRNKLILKYFWRDKLDWLSTLSSWESKNINFVFFIHWDKCLTKLKSSITEDNIVIIYYGVINSILLTLLNIVYNLFDYSICFFFRKLISILFNVLFKITIDVLLNYIRIIFILKWINNFNMRIFKFFIV